MNTKRRADCQLRHDWKERIIRIGDEQTSLQNQFDNLRNDFTYYPPKIEALEADVNSLNGRVIIAEADIADAENRITACEADIDRIDAELVDKTGEINNLANRMSLAEADIDDIDARLEGIETGNILLSQLNVDADKDMGGKALNNVKINANEVKVRGSQIEPTRINNDIVLIDIQPDIDAESCPHTHNPPVYLANTDPELPFSKYIYSEGPCWLYRAPEPVNSVLPFVPIKRGNRIYVEFWHKSEGGVRDNVFTIVYYYDGSKNYITQAINETSGGSIWGKRQLVYTPPENARYIKINCLLNNVAASGKVSMAGLKIYTDANFDSDLSAKIIAADGIVIKDGGTVDGVDVSTHRHDGSAVGGPKISYNNLADKPVVDVATHNHDGTAVGGVKIDLDNIVVSKSKDFNGKSITNAFNIGASLAQLIGANGGYPLTIGTLGRHNYRFTVWPSGLTLAPSTDVDETTTFDENRSIELNTNGNVRVRQSLVVNGTINGATITAAKQAEWDRKADGTIFTPAKATEWDGKARPPVPFYKKVTISELTAGQSVWLDVLPSGRSGIMLTNIRIPTFSRTENGYISMYFVADDSSGTVIDTWIEGTGEKTFDEFTTVSDMSTKNAITNIKFTVAGNGTVSAELYCYGYVY